MVLTTVKAETVKIVFEMVYQLHPYFFLLLVNTVFHRWFLGLAKALERC